MISSIFQIHALLTFISFINVSDTLNECGNGINLCDTAIKMPWTQCFKHGCNGVRKSYTVRCCGNMHKTQCYKFCNITDKDLYNREPCAPRCVNGVLEFGKCKCHMGYFGNCCGKKILFVSRNMLLRSFNNNYGSKENIILKS